MILAWIVAKCIAWLFHEPAPAPVKLLIAQAYATDFQAASEVSQPEKIVQKPPQKVLSNRAVLQAAQQSLAQLPEWQGKPLRVFQQIAFFDGERPRIELALQNPTQPESLIFYTYEQGKWTASQAEDVSHIKNLTPYLFDLNSVQFVQAADIGQTWQQKAQEVNAAEQTPYYVALVWLPKPKKLMWHTATLEATRAQYYLSCHLDGSVWEFNSL
ncbi:hypothetical protein [Kingella negevensis]|uniref:hypothetical protein n=1 Tax=Kingella negevensis TaxID=1522312 RepID=UPI00050A27E4|nr:hypothetical protein [Kingella negevensis]MDK4687881.1 hypothetical protein [Kingella negevensis]WII91127.1 hypothetical protein QEO93_00580 [Kingella negevensis]